MFNSKKKRLAELKASWGKLKDESFDFNKIARYFLLSDKKHFHQVISDRTFQDLDLDEVFMFLDRTTSKIGQQFLYQVVRTIPGTTSRSEKFEKIIKILKEDPTIHEKILLELSSLKNRDAYYVSSLFLENHNPKPKWYWIIPLLSLISLSTVVLSFIFPKFILFLIVLLAVNFGIHYWNKLNMYQYSGSIPQLLKLNYTAKRIASFGAIQNPGSDILKSINAIDSLGIQMSLFKLEVKLQSEIGQVVEYLIEWLCCMAPERLISTSISLGLEAI